MRIPTGALATRSAMSLMALAFLFAAAMFPAVGGIEEVAEELARLEAEAPPAPDGGSPYLGSETCGRCHQQIWSEFSVSGHPYKLMRAERARNRPIPLPDGYRWDDISYVIGGYKWKVRFMDTDGYIITETEDGEPGMNQYNMLTGTWTDYNPGQLLPYNCGRCHTTGFLPEGNQGGLPGIQGTWAAPGIQCEACHGPSARGPEGVEVHGYIDRSSELCGQCHIRGDADTIPASGGFIRHHEQYNEMRASPHEDAGLTCVSCHDPHKRGEFSIHTESQDCHGEIAASYAGTPMDKLGVDCVDCHMPFASKSAVALGPFKGDVRTHLFLINTATNGNMFNEAGNFVALTGSGRAAVTIDFACLSCHTTESRAWAAFYAKNFHGQDQDTGTTRQPPRRIPRRGVFR